jgi:hypothetical protein
MGACEFSNVVVIKGNEREAYSEANEEMSDENGHQEGYSGDIQTSNGFSKRTDNPRFGTAAFENWEQKISDNMDKGDCVCVELKGTTLKKMKERRGMKGRKGYRAFYFFGMARC